MAQGRLPERLKYERERRGLSVRDAAAEAKINRHTLGKIERGVQNASSGTIRKLAELYGVPAEELYEEAARDPLVPAPPPQQVVRMKWEEPSRRAFGEMVIIDRILFSEEDLARLLRGEAATGLIQTEGGERLRVPVEMLGERPD